MRNAVEPLGATVTVQQIDGKDAFVIRSGEATLVAQPSGCSEATGCVGLLISKLFRPPEGVSRADLLAQINAFNEREPFVKIVLGTDGQSVRATRYVISDHGQNYGNLRVDFAVLDSIANSFAQDVLGL